jgi:peptide/nickel transport system permease protein
MSYILRRIGFYLVAAWASLTLNFFLPRMMPGDPGDAIMARMQGRLTPETVDAMRQAYGLSDDPVILQYLHYLGNLARGEFGVSISAFPSPVLDVIFKGFAWTVLLGTTATIVSFAIGSVLGWSSSSARFPTSGWPRWRSSI